MSLGDTGVSSRGGELMFSSLPGAAMVLSWPTVPSRGVSMYKSNNESAAERGSFLYNSIRAFAQAESLSTTVSLVSGIGLPGEGISVASLAVGA